jgi:Ca-activated chloride channel homolog
MLRFHHLVKYFRTLFPRSIRLSILSLIFCSFATEIALADSVDSNIQAGISDYQQQNFEQAENNFSKALKEQPDNPELNYNLANSHYKAGKFQEALKSYSDAASNKTTPDLKQNSLYNSGNALFRMGKLEESIKAYKKVLEMNPKDMDAKYNLEFARLKLKEKNQQEQKQNQPQDGDPDDSENSKQKQSPENNRDDQQESETKNEHQEPAPPKQTDQENDSSSPEQQKSTPSEMAQESEGSISKDQAEQWLSGLDEDLKKFSQKQAHAEGGNAAVSNRDW